MSNCKHERFEGAILEVRLPDRPCFRLEAGATPIGRGADNLVQVNDPSVSSFHCEIILGPNGAAIRDLGSTNGTFVAGQRVPTASLTYGEPFRLANVECVLREAQPPSALEPDGIRSNPCQMNPENPDAIKIFGEAWALSVPAERAAYLDRACAGKPDLRQELESLLSAHARAGDFLQQTFPDSARDILVESPGTRIGRYKVLHKIGEGGFGIVYMAEQVEPVQRRVALKIIKPGMDSREVVTRFEAERQALALMDHPNIAKVLDGGLTDTGRPYLVMELVQGISITRYSDQQALSPAERLQIFIQVCHAVQHAHQKGIIHRDLKPNNVLVTLYDGKPVPKIIDFGVAKALGQKLTEKTLFTAFQQMIGTPAYMSPEQAELSGLDVDTRSDIYSLGVLLYELLTGVTPFDAKILATAALDEVRRIIREQEPLKPSTRLQTLGNQLAEVARHRQIEPTALGRFLRGDLDRIVMKCLEKDRQSRYDTAQSVALDIVRYLIHEPVSAVAPSTPYLAWKFTRRHKKGLAIVSALVLTLMGGVVVSTWQAVRVKSAEKRVETVARKLTQALTGVSHEPAAERDTRLMLDLLGKTRAQVDSELKNQPQIASWMQDLLRAVEGQLGNYAKPTKSQQSELERQGKVSEALIKALKNYGGDRAETATALANLGAGIEARGELSQAELAYQMAYEIRLKLLDADDPALTESRSKLIEILLKTGQTAKAAALEREAGPASRPPPDD